MKLKFYLLCSLGISFFSLTSKAQTYNINTVAGNGTAGYRCDGGDATSAEIWGPYGVAVDGSGNLYIAEYFNHRIRKVNNSGIISTYAGNGTQGYNGDGGDATNAEIDPFSVAADANGNVYIVDLTDHVVRKVNTSGTISTVAGNGSPGNSGDGGQATAAELQAPYGAAIDGSGNLYIVDNSNNLVRKVNTSGVISTFAGNGTSGSSGDDGQATAAELSLPYGISADANGNVYISDAFNNKIRKVNTSGVISTVAGNGTQGYSGDGGAATAAALNTPNGVAVDHLGNIYISDDNDVIREVNTGGTISTIAGNGMQGYSGDGGAATAAELWNPYGVAVDGSGHVFIADEINARIRGLISTSGINQISEDDITKFFPNPNNGNFTIQLQNVKQNTLLQIFDVLGQKVYEANLNSTTTQINLCDQPKGIYLYRIATTDGQFISSGKVVME